VIFAGRTVLVWVGSLATDDRLLENDAVDESAVRGRKTGRWNDWRGVAVESEAMEVDEAFASFDGR